MSSCQWRGHQTAVLIRDTPHVAPTVKAITRVLAVLMAGWEQVGTYQVEESEGLVQRG